SQAQGAGLVDLPAAAGVEIAADPATVSFGRVDGDGWQATQTVSVRNLSSRPLTVYVAAPKGGAAISLSAPRLELPPHRSATLTVRARAADAATGALGGKLGPTPPGGQAPRAPAGARA